MNSQCDDILEELVSQISEPGIGAEESLKIVRELVAREPATFHAMEPVVKAFTAEPDLLWRLREVCVDARTRHHFLGVRYLADRNAAVRSWALTVAGIDTRPFVVLLEQNLASIRREANDQASDALAREADVRLRGAFALSACYATLEEVPERLPAVLPDPPAPQEEHHVSVSWFPRILFGGLLGVFCALSLVRSSSGTPDFFFVGWGCVVGGLVLGGIGVWMNIRAKHAGRLGRESADRARHELRAEVARKPQRRHEVTSRAESWVGDLRNRIRTATSSGDPGSIDAVCSALTDFPDLFTTPEYGDLVSRLERYRDPVFRLADLIRRDHVGARAPAEVPALTPVIAEIAANYRRCSALARATAGILGPSTDVHPVVTTLPEEYVDAFPAADGWRPCVEITDDELDVVLESAREPGRPPTLADSEADELRRLREVDQCAYVRLSIASLTQLCERVDADLNGRLQGALAELADPVREFSTAARDRIASDRLETIEGAMGRIQADLDRSAGLQALAVAGGAVGLWKVSKVEEQVRKLQRSVQRKR